MRLIDSEPLVEDFEGLARSLANARCFSAADAIQGAAEKLRNAPTIDAEPVRHGRWIPMELGRTIGMFIGVECSLCSFEKIGHGYKYCPSCGAKMRGENECSDG